MTDELSQSKPCILVADDEKYNRILLSRILRDNYDIDFAANGKEVLARLEATDYDALLLDVMMPVMTGIEALEIIRQSADLATLPVILISAMSDNDSIVTGISMGANDFIPKPIDAEIVRARLKTQVSLKQLMDERKVVASALEEANEMKLRMMQIASHDLRNPLNNLSLLVHMMNKTAGQEDPDNNYASMAFKNISTIVQIIDDFLTTDLHEEINIESNLCQLSSRNLMEDILMQYHMTAKAKNIDIRLENFADTMIIADEARIKQVISNLLSNAIKYTPRAQTITVRSCESQNTWRLEIQDSGPGIPESEQQYLFQAFSKNRISTEPTAGESSTGLGLWIAARMMQLQQGSIGMDSPAAGGSCFWIEIPCVHQALSVSA